MESGHGSPTVDSVDEHYIYDGDRMFMITDGSGDMKEVLYNGPGADQVLAEDRGGANLTWNVTDHEGSVREVLDADGTIIWKTDYDAYGNAGNGGGRTIATANLDPYAGDPPYYVISESLPFTPDPMGISLKDWDNDDLAVLMGKNEQITLSESSGHYTITIPADGLIIRNNLGFWDLKHDRNTSNNPPKWTLITDGTHTYDFHDHLDGNGNVISVINMKDLELAGFATRDAAVGVFGKELMDRAWFGPDGKAHVKFGLIGEVATHLKVEVREAAPQRFMYDGGEYDPESGLTLFSRRYYDASTGRFVTQDPAEADSLGNDYRFGENDPVMMTDTSGLMAAMYGTSGFTLQTSFTGAPAPNFNYITSPNLEPQATHGFSFETLAPEPQGVTPINWDRSIDSFVLPQTRDEQAAQAQLAAQQARTSVAQGAAFQRQSFRDTTFATADLFGEASIPLITRETPSEWNPSGYLVARSDSQSRIGELQYEARASLKPEVRAILNNPAYAYMGFWDMAAPLAMAGFSESAPLPEALQINMVTEYVGPRDFDANIAWAQAEASMAHSFATNPGSGYGLAAMAQSRPMITGPAMSIRIDPNIPGRADPRFSVDTSSFTSGRPTASGGVRNAEEFWRQWQLRNPQTISPANAALISVGEAPSVDKQWLQYFPEHAAYMNGSLFHHHVQQGPFAIPVPAGAHPGFSREWHQR
jgi:RHS repeat-associated protein